MADFKGVEFPESAKSPVDWAKTNPAGQEIPRIHQALNETDAANEQYVKALQERFAQPNWFKIAGAFAKPQLGGFLASLGSAADVMGENVEQQRAIEPTIYRMRSEIAAKKTGLTQRSEADRILKEKGATPESYREIVRLAGPDSEQAKAVKAELDAKASIATTSNVSTETEIKGQKAVAENPFLILKDPMFKGTVADPQPDQIKNYLTDLNLGKPKDMPDSQWNAMGITAKQNAVAEYANRLNEKGMDEEQKSAFVARSADNLLNDLTYLRTLAVEPKLAPLFSLFKNGDAIGMFRAYLDKNPGNTQAAIEGLTAAAMENLKNADDATRAKADRLIKGIARLEVNLRGSSVNPTNAFQELNSNQSPSLANSQAGFVGILDQMGLQAKHDLDRHDLRIESNIPARKLLTGTQARALENRLREEQIALAKSNPLDFKTMPSWYTPSASQNAVKNEKAVAPTKTTAPTKSATQSNASIEAEMKKRGLLP